MLIGALPVPISSDALRQLPPTPGVYFFFDSADRLLYIGKSVNVRTRVRSYFRPNGGHSYRTERLKDEAARLDVQVCGSELEALLVESRLIKRMLPLYNVLGRNYRHFPFIKIPNEPFPRVELTYELCDDGGTYFGPFPSEYRAREALEAMRPLFKWRSCSPLPTRACFEHAIGRCAAPCEGRIDAAGYRESLDSLSAFLTGDGGAAIAKLEGQMHAAAEDLMFERAAILRNRLAMLRPLVERHGALQAAIAELDCLIALPSAVPGEALWLVVRRGRLVHTEAGVTRRRRRGIEKRLSAVLSAEPPSLTVQQWELDEINIIASWLHRHHSSRAAVGLSNRSLAEAMDEALALSPDDVRPAQIAAERAAERRIGPPPVVVAPPHEFLFEERGPEA